MNIPPDALERATLAAGDSAPPRTFGPMTRQMFVRYAGASGDFNPIHYDDDFAKSAGFPSVFSQGMYQAGLLATYATDWLGPENVRRFHVRFREQVWPGDELTCTGQIESITATGEGPLATVRLECKRQNGALAIAGTAEFLLSG